MARWRCFREQKDEPVEGKDCLWCGAPLRATRWHKEQKGDYGDGLFCGLRCGYQYAVEATSKHGFRMRVKGRKAEEQP